MSHLLQNISETFPKPISLLGMEKLNLTQQKHTFTNQKKLPQHKILHKKLKPGLVASYDIQPGNGEGRFWFRCFINLSLGWLVGWGLTALLTQNRSYRACKFVGIFQSKL